MVFCIGDFSAPSLWSQGSFYLCLVQASSSSSLQFPSSCFSHTRAPPLTQALGLLGRYTLPLLGYGLLDSVKRNKIIIWKDILWRISSTIPLKVVTTRHLCSLESDHIWCGKFEDGCLWKWMCWRSLSSAVQNVAARREADSFPHFLNGCSNQHNCWRCGRHLLTPVLRPDLYMQLLLIAVWLVNYMFSWNRDRVSTFLSEFPFTLKMTQ